MTAYQDLQQISLSNGSGMIGDDSIANHCDEMQRTQLSVRQMLTMYVPVAFPFDS